ncbi:hypothetical protein [Natronorubrum sp. FCH18a]|uniref:hypothetical protein n=1 Tax=Natronorubrum sp. FCH18a TaxID=3447018 RepID=UPI003F5131CD
MTAYNSVVSPDTSDRDDGDPDAAFQVAVAVYSGALLAGFTATAAVLTASIPTAPDTISATVGTAYAGGFGVGCVAGVILSRVDRRLPIRLGRTLIRRLTLLTPTIPFVVLWLAPLEPPVDVVAVWSVIAVFVTGYVLSQLAGNRYVDAVTPGEPDETWRWDPPGSVRLDVALFVLYIVLAVGNAVSGNWLQALLWLTLGVVWIGSCLAEGRWAFGPGRDRCEIQFYETGLVKRRPYTKTFVAWHDIDHTRLRGDELVLDYGLRDVRFDRDELEDPDAVLEAVDRRLSGTESGYQ